MARSPAAIHRDLAETRAELEAARRGDPLSYEYYDEEDRPLDLDENDLIEYFDDQVRSLRRELSLHYFTASGAFGRFRPDRRLARERGAHVRRGPRARRSRPAPARRRGSRRTSAGSRTGPDDLGESEPPPRLGLRWHPRYGACSPSLLAVLAGAAR